MATLSQLQTPALLLKPEKMWANLSYMYDHIGSFKKPLRVHMKTVKSSEIAQGMIDRWGIRPITVSTLQEAEAFLAIGFTDIIYAVGLAPQKIDRVRSIIRKGSDLKVIIDSVEQADALVCSSGQEVIPVLVEIDCDGHRAGVPYNEHHELLQIIEKLQAPGIRFAGILSHSGESYSARSVEELRSHADHEHRVAGRIHDMLRSLGYEDLIISIGSTPAIRHYRDLSNVTEVRAGVFMFYDLVQWSLGGCGIEDIAISVAATVTGHQKDKGWILVDAGWMALTRDPGNGRYGYGIVCNEAGIPYDGLYVKAVHQEHGTLALQPGYGSDLPDLAIGTVVRIIPNHACATAAQFDSYKILNEKGEVTDEWSRFRGW